MWFGLIGLFFLPIGTLAFAPICSTPKSKWSTPTKSSSLLQATSSIGAGTLHVGDVVGTGSYGTVHLCTIGGDPTPVICKRAWTQADLVDVKDPKEREGRCRYYFDVEKHCFEKMDQGPRISNYLGSFPDDEGRDWMTFSLLTEMDSDKPAKTLCEIIRLDWKKQHEGDNHHLFQLQRALGMKEDATVEDVLDRVFISLFEALSFVHFQGVVHRDIKPGNLLCDAETQSLVLIDFGSAADMEPVKSSFFSKKLIGLENEKVAVSPIYSAPEVFVKPNKNPFQFDVFSGALIFCQLLFNLLDIRMDAGFHQQLEAVNFDLDSWLSQELSAKVRPAGIEEALDYLAERPGLWGLLKDMFLKDPEQRISSSAALRKFKEILAPDEGGTALADKDGPFFESVVSLVQSCVVPDNVSDYATEDIGSILPRPLHYVATFERSKSLGLVLAEADGEFEGREQDLEKWKEATSNAQPGAVFIQDVVEGSQADTMGIFEVGDQLEGVGELPLANGGFERAVAMLEQQPRSQSNIKLHFDRQSLRTNAIESEADSPTLVSVVDEGAWSVTGRRKAQEDAFMLHDLHLDKDVLLAGVFDGHGGAAASTSAATLVPNLFAEELRTSTITTRQALEIAWKTTCTTYKNGCDEMEGECIAEYDAMEGILLANTGAQDLVAGTTASMVALKENEITFLNCGDSRSLLINDEGKVVFATEDHTPEREIDRLEKGRAQGFDYSIPECSLSKWYIKVGDYQYAVCRSLEGPFATSKGIVSDPDVSTIRSRPGVLVCASDGLFEVIDNELVGKEVARAQKAGVEAGDVAKRLCSLALEKGSSDNVSAVVVYIA